MAPARAKQTKNLKGFYTALIFLAVAGGLVIAYVASRPPAPAVTPVDISQAPPAAAEGYTEGKPDAPVEIMEFGDFACVYCANFTVVLEPEVRAKLIETGQARLTYHDFLVHDNSLPAHLAAACANDQGKFWEMHDRLYNDQADWVVEKNPKKLFEKYAEAVGVALPAWDACYDSKKYQPRVLANSKLGQQLGVASTPTFVIGGRMLAGAYGYDSLKVYVAAAAADAARKAPAAPASQAAKTP